MELLRDGQWHTTSEIRLQMELKATQMKQIAAFLKEYGFIESDEKGRKIRIEEYARRFLAQTASS